MKLRASHLAIMLAVGGSCALHIVGFGLSPQAASPVLIEGGSQARVARLGNSFEDMVQGMNAPVVPEELQDTPLDETQQTPRSEAMADEANPDPALTPDTDMAATPRPLEETGLPEPPTETAVLATDQTVVETVAEAASSPILEVLSDSRPAIAVSLATHAMVQPIAAVLPAPGALIPSETSVDSTEAEVAETERAQVPDIEVMIGETPIEVQTPDETTMRPQARPASSPEPVERPEPVQTTAPQPPTPPAQGGTEIRAQGQDDGRENEVAVAANAESQGQSSQAGNASASNYPGRVIRQLRRVRRPRGVGRGTAIVGFLITGSGGVGSVWLVTSSGNAALDQAAIQHVHLAAPFPSPPQGAETRFSFAVEGR